MTNDQAAYLTTQGHKNLQEELNLLVHTRRKEIANRIQEAKELGDLSENAEYQEAKNEQAFNEGRIEEIENILRRTVIIESNHRDKGSADVGSTLSLNNGHQDVTVKIVGSNEADPMKGLISNDSPLGHALIGHKPDDQVVVETPKGPVTYKINSLD